MRTADKLNIAGFVIASAGSMLGMAGALQQTNAYYPFKPGPFLGYMLRITFGPILRKSVADEIHTAAKLSEKQTGVTAPNRYTDFIFYFAVSCSRWWERQCF